MQRRRFQPDDGVRRVARLGWMLGIGLLPSVPPQWGWADDGESLPAPGIGNEVWTAEDGETTQSYTVTVTRAAAPLSTDATLSALALSGIDIGTFDAATTAYSATVARDVSSTTVTATATDESATVTLSDGESSATDGALDVSLGYGANTITVTVTAEDGQTTQSYVVTVTRPRGAPTIRGTPQVGEVLTAWTDGIADEDGLNEAYTMGRLRTLFGDGGLARLQQVCC